MEDWGKLIGDVPSATAILDRFLHHAVVLAFSGKSYRLRNQATGPAAEEVAEGAKAPAGPGAKQRVKSPTQSPSADAAACET
ncbi:MAG: ATP-binding protein [Bradyrhizobium sp.]